MAALTQIISNRPDFETYFPYDQCVSAIGELSAWVSVPDISAAGRFLSNKPQEHDDFANQLLLPFLDDDGMQEIMIITLGWLRSSFRVPERKIAIAKLFDSDLTNEICNQIQNVKFQSKVMLDPHRFQSVNKRCLVVEDEPHVIELIQNPIRVLSSVLDKFYGEIFALKKMYDETESKPNIYHRPYGDSSLTAVLDAISYFACGMKMGPKYESDNFEKPEISYKAINLVGRPPFDQTVFNAVKEMNAQFMVRFA